MLFFSFLKALSFSSSDLLSYFNCYRHILCDKCQPTYSFKVTVNESSPALSLRFHDEGHQWGIWLGLPFDCAKLKADMTHPLQSTPHRHLSSPVKLKDTCHLCSPTCPPPPPPPPTHPLSGLERLSVPMNGARLTHTPHWVYSWLTHPPQWVCSWLRRHPCWWPCMSRWPGPPQMRCWRWPWTWRMVETSNCRRFNIWKWLFSVFWSFKHFYQTIAVLVDKACFLFYFCIMFIYNIRDKYTNHIFIIKCLEITGLKKWKDIKTETHLPPDVSMVRREVSVSSL